MPKRRGHPPEFQRLLDQARSNEKDSPARKHHLVPASYLRRWADEGQVRVTVVDERRSYPSSPEKAARETDFYRLEHPEIDPDKLPPLLFETMLSRIEDNAKTVTDELLRHRNIELVDPERVALFAWHLSFSITRGKAFRAEQQEMLNDFYRLQYAKVTDDGIRAQLRRHGVDPTPDEMARNREFLNDLQTGDAWVERPEAAVIAMSADAAEPLGEHLFERSWVLFRTPPILVTCDEPVLVVGGPGSPRSERSGVGIAGAILYPLGPSDLLVLFHRDMRPTGPAELDHAETAEVNREIIAGASRWVFERPSRRVGERLHVPPSPPKAFLREGPLPQVEGADGELYRFLKPTRWSDDPCAPPWPVRRWWGGWQAEDFPSLANLPPGARVAIRGDRGRDQRSARRRTGP